MDQLTYASLSHAHYSYAVGMLRVTVKHNERWSIHKQTMAVKAEAWVEAVTESGRKFMAAWRQEEEDVARHRQEKREATRLGKLQSHMEA